MPAGIDKKYHKPFPHLNALKKLKDPRHLFRVDIRSPDNYEIRTRTSQTP